eukprot:TRINITY_DN7061_c0_g1_i1.p1 TRINITY_DN7061_c0_g1~~TRINITY_DN7061_c0_g1_i1.p1  ORF type:complete len:428 (-),score=151.39 TRINITY_DN7061_c0_g1_i1:130-1323(-)
MTGPYEGWTSCYSMSSILFQLQSFLFDENVPEEYGGDRRNEVSAKSLMECFDKAEKFNCPNCPTKKNKEEIDKMVNIRKKQHSNNVRELDKQELMMIQKKQMEDLMKRKEEFINSKEKDYPTINKKKNEQQNKQSSQPQQPIQPSSQPKQQIQSNNTQIQQPQPIKPQIQQPQIQRPVEKTIPKENIVPLKSTGPAVKMSFLDILMGKKQIVSKEMPLESPSNITRPLESIENKSTKSFFSNTNVIINNSTLDNSNKINDIKLNNKDESSIMENKTIQQEIKVESVEKIVEKVIEEKKGTSSTPPTSTTPSTSSTSTSTTPVEIVQPKSAPKKSYLEMASLYIPPKKVRVASSPKKPSPNNNDNNSKNTVIVNTKSVGIQETKRVENKPKEETKKSN